MGVHDGHRQRLKERYLREGLDSFEEVNVLELILFYSVPRKDTNELAHALLKKFKTLSGVLNASPEELTSVDGIADNSAVLLGLFRDVYRKNRVAETKPKKITASGQAFEFLHSLYLGVEEEVLYMICMDSAGKVICHKELGRGSVLTVEVNMNKGVQLALNCNAVSVIISHNHPGGIPSPSQEDVEITMRFRDALALFSIRLSDHIIVAGDTYFSFAEADIL